jgi:hypothetical protein
MGTRSGSEDCDEGGEHVSRTIRIGSFGRRCTTRSFVFVACTMSNSRGSTPTARIPATAGHTHPVYSRSARHYTMLCLNLSLCTHKGLLPHMRVGVIKRRERLVAAIATDRASPRSAGPLRTLYYSAHLSGFKPLRPLLAQSKLLSSSALSAPPYI